MVCIECGFWHDGGRYRLFCDRCTGLLGAQYDTPPTVAARLVNGARGTRRYLPTLPITHPSQLVTMGEGDTPVVPLPRVGETLGIGGLHAKLEFLNPTGSFKD